MVYPVKIEVKWRFSDMGKAVAIGLQDFGKLRERDFFYIDKTSFIIDWWDCGGRSILRDG